MVRRGRLSRQQRLLRTGVAFVVIIAIAALIANALGGGSKKATDASIAHVAFLTTVRSASDAGTPNKATVAAEAQDIVAMLNDWYQTAYIDPSQFGDGTFPSVAAHFAGDAKASFTKDIGSFTIAEARTRVARVVPSQQRATITVFMLDGKTPTYATALIRFMAVATQTRATQPKIRITQHASLHLEKIDGTWKVTYYTADSSEDPIAPPPTGSPSP